MPTKEEVKEHLINVGIVVFGSQVEGYDGRSIYRFNEGTLEFFLYEGWTESVYLLEEIVSIGRKAALF